MQPKLDSREVHGRKLTVSENPYLQKTGDTGMGKERDGVARSRWVLFVFYLIFVLGREEGIKSTGERRDKQIFYNFQLFTGSYVTRDGQKKSYTNG